MGIARLSSAELGRLQSRTKINESVIRMSCTAMRGYVCDALCCVRLTEMSRNTANRQLAAAPPLLHGEMLTEEQIHTQRMGREQSKNMRRTHREQPITYRHEQSITPTTRAPLSLRLCLIDTSLLRKESLKLVGEGWISA